VTPLGDAKTIDVWRLGVKDGNMLAQGKFEMSIPTMTWDIDHQGVLFLNAKNPMGRQQLLVQDSPYSMRSSISARLASRRRDRIALVYNALDQHCRVDPGPARMGLRNVV